MIAVTERGVSCKVDFAVLVKGITPVSLLGPTPGASPVIPLSARNVARSPKSNPLTAYTWTA